MSVILHAARTTTRLFRPFVDYYSIKTNIANYIQIAKGLAVSNPALRPYQQTQNICITFVQRRPNVFDVGPTLYKCYTNVLRLLG